MVRPRGFVRCCCLLPVGVVVLVGGRGAVGRLSLQKHHTVFKCELLFAVPISVALLVTTVYFSPVIGQWRLQFLFFKVCFARRYPKLVFSKVLYQLKVFFKAFYFPTKKHLIKEHMSKLFKAS